MKKQRAKLRISQSSDYPYIPACPLPIAMFYADLEIFLNDYFRGSFHMERPENDMLAVMISPNGFSHFLRCVFSAVYGRASLGIAFEAGEDHLWMKFSMPKELFNEDEWINLYRQAMAANFSVKEIEEGIAIGISLTEYEYNRVYARDRHDLYASLLNVFFCK